MSEAIVPLVSVLLGAVLGAGTTLGAEGIRARNARQHELLQVRREVELDALENARRLVQRLADFVTEHRFVSADDGEDAQASAADALFGQLEVMQSLSLRVQVLANFEVSIRIDKLELAIRGFMLSSLEAGAIDYVHADALLTHLRTRLNDLAAVIRDDLRTAEVDRPRVTHDWA